ncbi:MAG TPA: NlpC/P60 family protein [Bacteroidales bacterium]|nr:NlpC/P60 family protein [Bacteroidales bacterium]HCB60584.1 NlpC/P60 family protein [Bacteroidales bacterium]HCY22953.1 NlpC/P60 family protein [Bacteroidales bacterium]
MKLFFGFLFSLTFLFCMSAFAQDELAMLSNPDSISEIHPDSTKITRPADSLSLRTFVRDSLINELITYSKTFLGVPYRYGGKSRAGFDCSGYVSTMFSHLGVTLSPSSYGMAGSGRVVPDSTLQPGDILFFVNTQRRRVGIGHVGMVVEVKDGQVVFLHSACNGGVRYDYLSSAYYKSHYYRAERIPLFDVE